MKARIYYKETTGEITSVEENVPEGNSVITVGQLDYTNYRLQYVSAGQLLDRPTMEVLAEYNLATGVPLVLSVPSSTRVFLNNEDLGLTEEETLSLVFNEEDNYVVSLEPPWPWLKKEIQIAVSNPTV